MLHKLTKNQIVKAISEFSNSSSPKKELSDGSGLFLYLRRSNGQPIAPTWHFRWEISSEDGKRRFKTESLGSYPEISIENARKAAEKRRSHVPSRNDSITFANVVERWFPSKSELSPKHLETVRYRIDKYLLPKIGHLSIREVSMDTLRDALESEAVRGKAETVRRTLQICSEIFRWAKVYGLCDHNPAHDLLSSKSFVPVRTKKHFDAITDPKEFGELLRAIDSYKGSKVVQLALKLLPLVVLRPGLEFRLGTWSEVSFELKTWTIPGSRMKKRLDHVVPLSHQAIEILKELRKLKSPTNDLILPNELERDRPISDGALLVALGRLQFKQTAHGFRASFQTIASEHLGLDFDALDKQLAHSSRKSNLGYQRAEYLDQRRNAMQVWSDYLDGLREGVLLPKLPTSPTTLVSR